MTTSALHPESRRARQNPADDSHLHASVAVALQSSLSAPNRNRSISVDDFRDAADHVRTALREDSVGASSSDSDDDENEDQSRRGLQDKRKRTDTALRRKKTTLSALSLESLQNDSDDSDPPFRRQTTSLPVNGKGASVGVEESRAVEESPAKRQKVLSPVIRAQEGSALAHVQTEGSQEGRPRARQKPNMAVKNTAAVPVVSSKPSPAKGDTQVSAEQGNTSQPEGDVVEVPATNAVTHASTNRRGLVNIASVPESDGSGWDRFIFFSFRPQRFHFPRNTYLSAFSPFAAVASGMVGVKSTGVCAVCGASEALVECYRCPLAFHSRCIDPKRRRMAIHPWFCDACQAVKGDDRSQGWRPLMDPSPLPSPANAFLRLTADARDGNPIDFVFNPTLHRFYKSHCGRDWLRCSTCQEIKVTEEGVLAESVHVPFECCYAFWGPGGPSHCSSGPRTEAVKKVEAYISRRSRRRNALFYYGFDEEDREDYGYPPLNRNVPVEDVIVIDEDESETVTPAPRKDSNDTKNAGSKKPYGNKAKQTKQSEKQALVKQGNSPPTATKLPVPVQKLPDGEFDFRFGRPQSATRVNVVKMPESTIRETGNTCGASNEALRRPPPVTLGQVHAAPKRAVSSRSSGAQPPLKAPVRTLNLGRQSSELARSGPVRTYADHATLNLVRENHPALTNSDPPVVHGAAVNMGVRNAVLSDSVSGIVSYAPFQQRSDVKREDETEQKPFLQPHQRDRIDDENREGVLACIASMDFDLDIEDCLTDLALVNDSELFALYKGMQGHGKGEKFKRQATRLARRRIALTDSSRRQNKKNHVEANPVASGRDHAAVYQFSGTQFVHNGSEGGLGLTSRPSAGPLSNQGSAVSAAVQKLRLLHERELRELDAALKRQMAATPEYAAADMRNRHMEQVRNLLKRQELQVIDLMSAGTNGQPRASRR